MMWKYEVLDKIVQLIQSKLLLYVKHVSMCYLYPLLS